MPVARIAHGASGFRCERLQMPLSLGLGLDGSAVLHYPGALPAGWLAQALDQLLIAAPQLSGIMLPYCQWREEPQAQALFSLLSGDYLAREHFWQLPLWLAASRPPAAHGMQYDETRALWFPRRPPRPAGEVYRRFDPRIGHTLSFRLPQPEDDLSLFTRWMNAPRINAFWEMAGPQEQQAAYLQRLLSAPHCYPLLGCFDDQPFGYFEVYWAAEDRIGQHYRWQPFDRGLHLLVGEEQWRGARYVRSWLSGLTHYLYLDQPRTTRIVAEPRADNQRLFRHLPAAGYRSVKEFDFPHKRSRLILNQRESFFQEVAL